MTATSANLSGHPATYKAEEVADQLRSCPPDYILDGGPISGGPPSTIIDVCTDPPEIVREGAISLKDIRTWVERFNACLSADRFTVPG